MGLGGIGGGGEWGFDGELLRAVGFAFFGVDCDGALDGDEISRAVPIHVVFRRPDGEGINEKDRPENEEQSSEVHR